MAHNGGKTAMIYRSDGTLHRGPRTDYNARGRAIDANAPSIAYGDRFLQIGNWRLCDIDGEHASICTVSGKTAQIFRYTAPTLHPGPRNDYCCNNRPIDPNHPNRPSIGDRYLQIGAWRWADIDGQHASLSREKHGTWLSAQIWRSDGTLHGGSRRNNWYCGKWGPRPACGSSESVVKLDLPGFHGGCYNIKTSGVHAGDSAGQPQDWGLSAWRLHGAQRNSASSWAAVHSGSHWPMPWRIEPSARTPGTFTIKTTGKHAGSSGRQPAGEGLSSWMAHGAVRNSASARVAVHSGDHWLMGKRFYGATY
jgi:hypothetical protein